MRQAKQMPFTPKENGGSQGIQSALDNMRYKNRLGKTTSTFSNNQVAMSQTINQKVLSDVLSGDHKT